MTSKVVRVNQGYITLLKEEGKKHGLESIPEITEHLAGQEKIIKKKMPGRPPQKINWNNLIDI